MQSRARRTTLFSFALLLFLSLPGWSAASGYEREIQSLADEMNNKIRAATKKTVAVVDMTDLNGNVTELGRFLAEELSVTLTERANGFEVVDRNRLAAILREQRLSASGLVDPQTVRQLGKIAGVEALALGSLTAFGETVHVTVKIIDVDTAKMIGSSRADVPRGGAIDEMLGKTVVAETPATTTASPAGTSTKLAVVRQKPEPVLDHKFVFELQGCELSGQAISCRMLIQNGGPDRVLKLGLGPTRLYDNLGNAYHPDSISVANSVETSRSDWAEQTLIYGVPTPATLIFRGIVPETSSISQLSIGLATENERFGVAFRNISIDQVAVPNLTAISGAVTGVAPQPGDPAAALNDLMEQQAPIQETIRSEAKKTIKEGAKRFFKGLLNRYLPVPLPSPPPL